MYWNTFTVIYNMLSVLTWVKLGVRARGQGSGQTDSMNVSCLPMAAGPEGAEFYGKMKTWRRFTIQLNEPTCRCKALKQNFFLLVLLLIQLSSSHRSVTLFFVSAYFNLSLSASATMMSITWPEWILQIPMAVFLLSVLSAAPRCLLEGIVHLALSLYTVLSRIYTHIPALTQWYCLFIWLKGEGGNQDLKWFCVFCGTV